MKHLAYIIITILILTSTTSCDKVEVPIKPKIELDTTLYSTGNWDSYPWPNFGENSNTDRNILLEDYTGHKCPNCPTAATLAAQIESDNPGKVFVASIHAAPGGVGPFQELDNDCSDPEVGFCYDFRTNEGTTYGQAFVSGFSFFGNPQGTINRITFGSDMFLFKDDWSSNVTATLTNNDLKVNLQASSNYYSSTNGVYLHIQSQFLENMTGNFNIVTYVIQNEIIEDQEDNGTHLYDYHHHNVFMGCIDEQAWGHSIGGTNPTQGTTNQTDYSYTLPTGLTSTDIHFLTYIYNVDTYEILQVIKHEI